MATSLFLSPPLCRLKSSFLDNTNLDFSPSRISHDGRAATARRWSFRSPVAKSSDRIPKQFREENLKDGVMENYKNAPPFIYGLPAAQLRMFTTEHSPVSRLVANIDEENNTFASSYRKMLGMRIPSGTDEDENFTAGTRMSAYDQEADGRGRRGAPPDFPSKLLESRIIYLGMPLVEAVTDIILAQLLYLEYDDSTKPIYLFINSTGTQDEYEQIVAAEEEACAIADAMEFCKSDIYTLNVSMAFGQAAMLLSCGTKGKRAVLPHSITRLYLPKAYKSRGPSTELWIRAQDLEFHTDMYLESLERGIGKPKEQLAEDLKLTKHLSAQSAVDYGVADMVLRSMDGYFQFNPARHSLGGGEPRRNTGRGGDDVSPEPY